MTRNSPCLLLCLWLSLLMALAGVQGALACPGVPATAVISCGHDAVIWLDAAGKPVKPVCRHCPACTGVALPSPPIAPTWAPRRVEPPRPVACAFRFPSPATRPIARGPPFAG